MSPPEDHEKQFLERCQRMGDRLVERGYATYMLDRKGSTRTELRVVSAEWSHDADDHWQSIFDLDDGWP